MTITIELPPDAVEVAEAQARAQGIDLPAYLSRELDQHLRSLSELPVAEGEAEAAPFSQEQFDRDWDEFSAGTESER